MKLIPYKAEKLDELALRVLDLAASLREMATKCRDNDVPAAELHDRKALEWLGRLEEWTHKSSADLNVLIMGHKGAKRAMQSTKSPES